MGGLQGMGDRVPIHPLRFLTGTVQFQWTRVVSDQPHHTYLHHGNSIARMDDEPINWRSRWSTDIYFADEGTREAHGRLQRYGQEGLP